MCPAPTLAEKPDWLEVLSGGKDEELQIRESVVFEKPCDSGSEAGCAGGLHPQQQLFVVTLLPWAGVCRLDRLLLSPLSSPIRGSHEHPARAWRSHTLARASHVFGTGPPNCTSGPKKWDLYMVNCSN